MQPNDLLALAKVREWCKTGLARDVRLTNHLSLREVASGVHASVPSVSKWERNLRKPTRAVGVRYAHFMLALAKGQTDAA